MNESIAIKKENVLNSTNGFDYYAHQNGVLSSTGMLNSLLF